MPAHRYNRLHLRPTTILLCLLLGAALAVAALAQPDAPDPQAVTAGEDPEAVADGDAAEDVSGETLLDDYEASEQISEDLSVSFPVDI